MSKKTWKLISIIGAASAVILATVVIYSLMHAGNPPAKPNFQGYKPSVLPDGVSAVDDGLNRTVYRAQHYSRFSYGINLNNGELRIIEAKTEAYKPGVQTCRGIGKPCQELVTADDQQYTVSYGNYKNKPFSLTVNWVKDGTSIMLSADDKAIDKYIRYDWGPIIDSFVPVDLGTMKIQTREGHCCGG